MSMERNIDDLYNENVETVKTENSVNSNDAILQRLIGIETRLAKLESGITEDIKIDRENNADVSERSETTDTTVIESEEN